jgi:hypothetical protein
LIDFGIQTSYDQNVQLILKSYLPVVYGTPLNPILKADDKLSVMPNTTSRYYELFLSQFTKDYEPKSINLKCMVPL